MRMPVASASVVLPIEDGMEAHRIGVHVNPDTRTLEFIGLLSVEGGTVSLDPLEAHAIGQLADIILSR